MADLYPQLPKWIPDYPPPTDTDQYRWGSQMDLPLTVRGTVIPARPDSGCEENIMSARMAEYFGLPVSRRKEDKKNFRVANGKIVSAVGRVSIWSCFPEEPWKEIQLDFYLFPQAVTPLIIGMSFLAETKVFNENRHRLRPRKVKRRGPYQVSLLNSPMKTIHCLAESEPARGYPDTGSEIDLMSLSYVTKRGFELRTLEDEESEVLFADGSSSTLVGKTTISLIVCSNSPLEGKLTFYVLEDLTCDMLFGEEFLHENEIFQKHQTAFGTSEADGFSDVNGIFWKTKGEKFLSKLISGREGRASSSKEGGGNYSIESQHDDSWELHRRELALEQINRLVGREKELALELEERQIAQYDTNRYRHPSYSIRSNGDELRPTAGRAGEESNERTLVPSNPHPRDTSESSGRSAVNDQNYQQEILDLPPLPQSASRRGSVELASHSTLPPVTEVLQSTPSTPPQNILTTDDVHPRSPTLLRTNAPPYAWPSPDSINPDTEDGSTPLSMGIDRMNINVITNSHIGVFRCTYPGCTAQSFQTQYLLNSHANVHTSNRPHYCPVKDCPRAEGGKGFKRKNEMIRHGLIHDSPGYVCPFCPDREHKYPRPDNIQR